MISRLDRRSVLSATAASASFSAASLRASTSPLALTRAVSLDSVAAEPLRKAPFGTVAPRVNLQREPPSPERDARVKACVDAVMAKIEALPELERIRAKVGQMIQYSDGALTGPAKGRLGGFDALVREGQVGSFLNALKPEDLKRLQKIAVEESPLGIPLLFAFDVIHGLHTTFPIPLAMACSWNPEMARKAAEVAGRESAEMGIHWTFAPMVDVARDPRWGRIAEGSGEDQFLGSRMAEGHVRGFNKYILSCVKHFAGYGAAEGGRDYNTVNMSRGRLHDVYLPPFRAALQAGADTAMTSFNDLNGVPSTGNPYLLHDVLRGLFKSDAMVVTDWNSIDEMIDHGVVRNREEAAALAAHAGVDMDMQSAAYAEKLVKLTIGGRVPEQILTDAARRIIRIKAEMGLFDDPGFDPKPRAPLDRVSAKQVAEESIVLLKNEGGLLPLKPSVKRIALVGMLADLPLDHRGSWAALGKDEDVTTIKKGLEERAAKAGASVRFVAGADRFGDATSAMIDAAVAAAKDSDVVIAVVGEHCDMSGEAASRSNIELPGNQRELLKALHERSGKPVVAVLMNGRPLVLDWEAKNIPAIVEGWQLGTEMGSAIASVLFGDKNPSGKLAVSFPVNVGQIPVHHQMVSTGRPLKTDDVPKNKGERWFVSRYIDAPNKPLFPFGFGLSYATFHLGAPKLSADTMPKDGTITVEVPVKNISDRAGKETVQVYVRAEDAKVTQPLRKLAGFGQIELAPGESGVVTIKLAAADLGHHDELGTPIEAEGEFKLYVGTDAYAKTELSFRVR